MTAPQVGGVAVTQADRDAATSFVTGDGSLLGALIIESVKAGRSDDAPLVQVFARHRIATTPTPLPALTGTVGAGHTGWRCFHCGDYFTDAKCAALHFGRDLDCEPACQIKAGAEQGLLSALRDAEYAASDAMRAIADECTDAARAHYSQMTRHNQAVRNAEEAGYERGLTDGRATPTPLPALTDTVGVLVEALKPFAVTAEHDVGDDEADTDWFRQSFMSHDKAPRITIGDLRRARAAIQLATGGQQS